MALSAERSVRPEVLSAYARLEDTILARDQAGASDVFYELVRSEVPLPELIGEIVRIHAPYTHVPYHQRLDDGIVRFVNNDHCLLSSRASLDLMRLMPAALRFLPLAQTIWYVPTGLDPWNQLLGKMPGHYVRLYELKFDGRPPLPEVHWADQAPLPIEGPWPERLNTWLTLVQRGEVVSAYRVFLGLWEEAVADPDRRAALLAQLVFAGLIDVQDRVFHNRSYTTGHKSYRARATVELAGAVGWERAHPILYAGVPDIAVGPRWYSSYEMGCLVIQNLLDSRDRELLANDGDLTPTESLALQAAILSGEEPGYIDLLVSLLRAGRGPRQIIDTIQLASAQLIIETGDPTAYSMPQHSYEYCNTVRWFLDTFAHPHRLKLLFVAGAFVTRAAHHQRHTPGNHPVRIEPPKGADALPAGELLRRLDAALDGLRAFEAMDWTAAYLQSGADRGPLVQTLAVGAAKAGNDPHNQELGVCLLEDYAHSTAPGRGGVGVV
ncbi:MAG TPA: hypothetical protein VNH46_04730, partial [Gemmatimonadales bacterium]|nr:hypothetical protein [Gemmatimonadales bacterium]